MLTAREEKLEKKREFQERVNQVISWVKQRVAWSQWGRGLGDSKSASRSGSAAVGM